MKTLISLYSTALISSPITGPLPLAPLPGNFHKKTQNVSLVRFEILFPKGLFDVFRIVDKLLMCAL